MGWFSKFRDKVKKFVDKVIDGFTDVVKKIGSFVGDAFNFVLTPFGAPQQNIDPGQVADGVKLTKSGTNVPIPVVYGEREVGGAVVHAETNGTDNKYLFVIYAICEGPINRIRQMKIDDRVVTPADVTYSGKTTNNFQTTDSGRTAAQSINKINAGIYKDLVDFEIYTGDPNKPEPSAVFNTGGGAGTWNSKVRTGTGLCYAAFRFSFDTSTNRVFSGGIPQVIFHVQGRKVMDLRSTSVLTPGSKDLTDSYSITSGSYTQQADEVSASTKMFAGINPANCLLDYMRNTRYGCGLSNDEIDAESFRIAAEKFDQTVTYSDTQTGKAMTMNAVINTGSTLIDNVKELVAGCRALLPYVDGRYKLIVEDGGNATDITSSTVNVAYDVDSNEFVGPITLSGETKGTKYNKVIVNYVDPGKSFTNQQVVYSDQDDIVSTGTDNDPTTVFYTDGEELIGEFNFPTLTNPAIARDLARMIYKKSRAQRTVSFRTTPELIDIIPGDIIRLTDPVLQLNQVTFRVISVQITGELNVQIDAVEHDATVYPFVSGAQIEVDPPIFLPSEPDPQPKAPTNPKDNPGTFPPGNTPQDPDDPDPGPKLPEPKRPDLNCNQFIVPETEITTGRTITYNQKTYAGRYGNLTPMTEYKFAPALGQDDSVQKILQINEYMPLMRIAPEYYQDSSGNTTLSAANQQGLATTGGTAEVIGGVQNPNRYTLGGQTLDNFMKIKLRFAKPIASFETYRIRYYLNPNSTAQTLIKEDVINWKSIENAADQNSQVGPYALTQNYIQTSQGNVLRAGVLGAEYDMFIHNPTYLAIRVIATIGQFEYNINSKLGMNLQGGFYYNTPYYRSYWYNGTLTDEGMTLSSYVNWLARNLYIFKMPGNFGPQLPPGITPLEL